MEQLQGTEGRERFGELVKDIKFAMLTTRSSDGSLHSRPMFTQDIEFDGELWFFTGASSGKISDIEANPDVNVAYSKPEGGMYVSVTGKASLSRDRAKILELWKPEYKIYFEDGPDDPDLILLKVDVNEAEYWTSNRNPVLRLFGLAKALVTKDPKSLGEQGHIEVSKA